MGCESRVGETDKQGDRWTRWQGCTVSHWGTGRGQTNRQMEELRSVTLGWETQMDRQTGGLGGVTPGGGAAEEQAVRQMDRMDTGQQCQCPWGEGWTEGWMEWGAGVGPEGSGSTERGTISNKTIPLGDPSHGTPSTHTQGAQGLCSPCRAVGCGGLWGPAPPWAVECRRVPLLGAQGSSTPSLTGEGRECRGAWLTMSGGSGGLCSHCRFRGCRRGAAGTLGVQPVVVGCRLRDTGGCREAEGG